MIFDRTDILRNTADTMGSAIFGGMVIGWKVTQSWAGRKQRQQVRRELVRHLEIFLDGVQESFGSRDRKRLYEGVGRKGKCRVRRFVETAFYESN